MFEQTAYKKERVAIGIYIGVISLALRCSQKPHGLIVNQGPMMASNFETVRSIGLRQVIKEHLKESQGRTFHLE